MSGAVVARAAVVSALGDTPGALLEALLAGRSGIGPVGRFDASPYTSRVAAEVDLPDPGERSRVEPLLDRLLAGFGPLPSGTVLFAASTKGGVDCLERLGRGIPARAADVALGAVAEGAARRLGLAGGITVSAACASGTAALARGAAAVSAGRHPAVVVVAVDLLSEFVYAGFSALQALSPGPCRPFDRDRCGLSLGEGAAAILLVHPGFVEDGGFEPLGVVEGWGIAGDARHITAPDREGSGLAAAIGRALEVAGRSPGEIGGVSAHGTGTVYNDAMELTALGRVFESPPPIYTAKGGIGHTMGAAGGIETALALEVLARGMMPPTVGLAEPDPAARGLASTVAVPLRIPRLLVTNSGFGGINAALVLGPPA